MVTMCLNNSYKLSRILGRLKMHNYCETSCSYEKRIHVFPVEYDATACQDYRSFREQPAQSVITGDSVSQFL